MLPVAPTRAHKYRIAAGRLRADTSSDALLAGSVLVTERVAAFYDAALPLVASGRLVDLGCGTAPLGPFYGPLVDTSVALDWPSSVHPVRVDVSADIATGVPLRSGSADVVLLSDVLEHLIEPVALLAECRRVLAPDGHLIGNVPFMYGLHEEPHDYFRYTEHALRRMLHGAGFGEVDVRPVGGGIDIAVDVVGKLTSQLPVVGPTIARFLQRTWFAVASRPAIRNRLDEVERRLPLGYGFVAGR